jgi:hypothetical protein
MDISLKDSDVHILISDLELILNQYGDFVFTETKHDVELDQPVRHIRDFIKVLRGE